ncbi:chitinase CLP-like [Zingiber officinale]|uniref:Peptidase A1 domain-containing protein n=1 Tax=Zingiber officinale TaxID=94328 RepID=A0A8J5I0K8_ZINOF|nr:chitinase CLP-like [Zingiber officinale]KAG6525663.1 hypothetical protein ZIOFF_015629 [Zingiber officinale]
MVKFYAVFLLLFFLCFTSSSPPAEAFPPPANAFVAAIYRDPATSLYTIPAAAGNRSLLLDLAGPLLWSPCPGRHPTIPCNSSTCAEARASPPHHCYNRPSPRPPCACTATVGNPVTGACAAGELTLTDVILSTTDGHHPTAVFDVNGIISSCAPTSLLSGLPAGAAGVAGLARSSVSLPSQLAGKFYFKSKQFALCLPSGNSRDPGVAFFGDGPFYLLPPPGIDVTALLTYTPLVKDPKSPAYYIHVNGFAVNQKAVQIPPGKLAGGVKFSTTVAYTTLRSDVFKPLLDAFDGATSGIPRMPAAAPFELCLNSSALGSTRVGYGVAPIDVMVGGGKNWTIFGANSLVDVDGSRACFAFVNGGAKAEPAVVIGSFQMENNLMLFDAGRSRVGFTSTLFGIMTTCSNFNFTMGIM